MFFFQLSPFPYTILLNLNTFKLSNNIFEINFSKCQDCMKFLTSKKTEDQYAYNGHVNNLYFETYFKCILKEKNMLIPINLR